MEEMTGKLQTADTGPQTRPAFLSLWSSWGNPNILRGNFRAKCSILCVDAPPCRLKLTTYAAKFSYKAPDLISQQKPLIFFEAIIWCLEHFLLTEPSLWTRNVTTGPVRRATCSLHLRLWLQSRLPNIARDTCYQALQEAPRSGS